MTKERTICINVPEEILEMWQMQKEVEGRLLDEMIIEAMDDYITKKLKEHGFDVDEMEVEVEEIAIEDISEEGWRILKGAGVDVETLKAEMRKNS